MMERRKIIINIVRKFIHDDLMKNKDSNWSFKTEIDNITFKNGNYIIKLEGDGSDNGYIVIGKDNSVKEFAYKGEPLFSSLSPLKKNNYYDEDREIPYGRIDDTYKHVNHKYGIGWTFDSGKTIANFDTLNMNTFHYKNHCTLTTVTAIFNYYKNLGFTRIDNDIYDLFHVVSEIAIKKGYYKENMGTFPWYIDNLVRDVWKHYGYEGTANNDFFFWDIDSINKTIKKEIDEGRPGIISFTNGNYGMHTVTFYGYKLYKKKGNDKKMYLKVNDNWTTSSRYIDTSFIGDLGETFFEICRVIAK